MSKMHKKTTLMHTYYRSFLFLIVIPLIVVFVGAEIVTGYMLRKSALETIDAFQDNVITLLSSDVRANSLQLSHFIHINDGDFTQTAVQVHNSTGSIQYAAAQRLQRAFRTAVVPSQYIVAGGFYMKDAGAVYMKEDIALPESVVRSTEWYRKAVKHPNTVILGGYDTSRTHLTANTQQGKQLVLVTAMATNITTDKSQQIEVITFFTISRVSDVISAQNRNASQGFSVILDRDGNVIYGDMGDERVQKFFAQQQEMSTPGSQTRRVVLFTKDARDYLFQTKAIPDTDWSIVTFVEEAKLGQRFYEIGSALALVVLLLLFLFYLYSRYFLNSIITPVHLVCEGMARLDHSDLEVQLKPAGQHEIRELMISFNQMVLSIKNMIAFTEETEKQKHQAEIRALQSQINPHFMVNTLNSIRFMAQVSKYDGIRKMAEALIGIVSCSFRSNVSFYTVREELEMLDTYVYLMRIRYSNGFEVSYDVQPDCLDYGLPRLILQPVVENAITHGFDELDEELGQIGISIFKEDTFLCLSVLDNGCGMCQKQIESLLHSRPRPHDDNTSIGLENVLSRIRLHFGEAAQIEIESVLGEFTRVVLRLPLAACSKIQKEERDDTDIDCG